jgi:NADPH:quinone reductase-like Zn-dependent oxidoreductase
MDPNGIEEVQYAKFDAMDFVSSNKSLLGFNISFCVDEIIVLSQLDNQVDSWLEQGKLQCPRVVEMDMADIAETHDLIQSGENDEKIVMKTHVKIDRVS